MSFSLYAGAFVDLATPVPAAWLNKVRTEIPNALDAVGGGDYANSVLIRFTAGSAGWRFDAPVYFSATGAITIDTTVTSNNATINIVKGIVVGLASTFNGAVTFNEPVSILTATLLVTGGDVSLGSGSNLVVSGGDVSLTTGDFKFSSHTETRIYPWHVTGASAGSPTAFLQVDGRWVGEAPSVTQFLAADLTLPNGSTLTQVKVYFTPPAGHANLPAVLPELQVWKVNASTGTKTQLGSTQTDAPANVAAYQSGRRELTVASLSHTVNRGAETIVAQFESESGANSLAGLECGGGCEVEFTTAKVDKGAGG